MKITAITSQSRDNGRVNVAVDGKYRLSLDVIQLTDLGVKVGREYTEQELTQLEAESQFGKLYARTLEYCLARPRSQREVRDYLYRKTRDARTKSGAIKKGVSPGLTERVFERLIQKGYVDDEKFAQFWIENRNVRKGSSRRKLASELMSKGIEQSVVERLLSESDRDDIDELRKIIDKKRARYDDEQKLIGYLVRQGFNYDDIRQALEVEK